MLDLQSIYFGQRHKDFDYKDFELVKKIARLERKHQVQCVNDCNGYGVVKGQMYYTGRIDDFARRTYGAGVKSGYTNPEDENETIFYIEISRIEDHINKLLTDRFRVEYQRDPRGNTVKLFYDNQFVAMM